MSKKETEGGEMKKNDGGPAFPTNSEHQSGPNTWHYEGMSLRDYAEIEFTKAHLLRQREYYDPHESVNRGRRMATIWLKAREGNDD